MRVAIVHYHLQRGGVTGIIRHTVRALESNGASTVVITGEAPRDDLGIPFAVVPELRYDSITSGTSSTVLHENLVQAAADTLEDQPDIWHFHNHSLGKNSALPGAINRLMNAGKKILLHIHDFAEDGRPENYRRLLIDVAGKDRLRLGALLYPVASSVHYAVLNERDYRIMLQAGAPDENIHLLPNPVEISGKNPDETGEVNDMPGLPQKKPGIMLYPTRAIRRKNIGEFILWSASPLFEGKTFALTMAPENPRERPFYEHWTSFVSEASLPVIFEYAQKSGLPFPAMVAQAEASVTTSIAEGFGLAFLEPWTMNRSVCGRDLPEITDMFRRDGIELPWMYDRLEVPLELLDTEKFKAKTKNAQGNLLDAYAWDESRPFPDLFTRWTRHGRVDFGKLDEELQAEVIKKLVAEPELFAAITPSALPHPAEGESITRHNREAIEQHYSLATYWRRLSAIYSGIGECKEVEPGSLDAQIILENFLSPSRLSLLRMPS